MRLHYVVRSFILAVVLAGTVVLAASSALGITIASPTEGQLIRDKVAIVIPRSSLPIDVSRMGFVTIKIDGRFLAALDAVEIRPDLKTPAGPNLVFVWDTKSRFRDDSLSEEQQYIQDGRHEILVEAHKGGGDTKDTVTESAKVVVNLKNKVDQPNPAPPLNLKYKFRSGQEDKYRITVSGEILDNTPNQETLTGGTLPIQGQFEIIQAVEDVNPDGSALIRYKVDKETVVTQIFGGVDWMRGNEYPSVYRLLDKYGKVLDANLLSGKRKIEINDCLFRLPGRGIKPGDNWPTEYKFKLEGLSNYTTFVGKSTLADFQWEGGRKCAVIQTEMSGPLALAFFPANGGNVGRQQIINLAYIDYEKGKLIKDVSYIQFAAALPNELLALLQQMIPSPPPPPPPANNDQNDQRNPNVDRFQPRPNRFPNNNNNNFNPQQRQQAPALTEVVFSITITKELVKK